MKRLGRIVIVILVTCIALYSGCSLMFPKYSFRYKLTTTVEVDGVPRSSSNIVQVNWTANGFLSPLAGGHPYGTGVRGVAGIMDLGKYGTLITSLGANAAYGSKYGHGSRGGKSGSTDADGVPMLAYGLKPPQLGMAVGLPKKVLDPRNYPSFIWLPREAFHPDAAQALLMEEFAELIGKNVVLKSVTIEPTSEPVVQLISPRPQWLEKMWARESGQITWRQDPRNFLFYVRSIETGKPQ